MSPYRGIPESVVEEIKQRNEIVSVVEQYVRLDKKSAQNFFGLCPFHSEDTPSFSVSPGKQIYYCFGCHKGGDVVHFIMDIEKVGYLDALKLLAEKAKIELPASDDYEYQKKAELQKLLYSANTEAARFFYMNLTGPRGAAGQEYLKRRGIDPRTAKRFGLGFAADDWEALYRHLKSKGYSEEIIFLTGLFKKRTDKTSPGAPENASASAAPAAFSGAQQGGRGMYDLFRNRLMFPIFDYLGRIVAFGGRAIDDSTPKYINSPETPIYTKGRHLYGFHIAKTSKAKNLIVVEGYMDAISMHQAGVDNAVASLGTALTEQQAMLIRKHSEQVIIAYDADAAGQAATLRGLEILTRKGCKVSVLYMPEGKDPDEFIRKNGPERFIALTKEAMPLMDYKLFHARASATTEGVLDRIAYQELACGVLAAEENRIVRELYAAGVAETLGVPAETVLAEVQRRSEKKAAVPSGPASFARTSVKPEEEPEKEDEEEARTTKEEIYFLCLLAADPRVYFTVHPAPELGFFSKGPMREAAKAAISLAEEKKLNSSVLVELGGDFIVNQRKLAELFAVGCMKIDETAAIRDLTAEALRQYERMQKNVYMEEKGKITRQLEQTPGCGEEAEALKQKLKELDKKISVFRS